MNSVLPGRRPGRIVLLVLSILLLAGCGLTPAATPAPAATPGASVTSVPGGQGGGIWEAVDAADATATAGAGPAVTAAAVPASAVTTDAVVETGSPTATATPPASPRPRATRTKAPSATPGVKATATPRDGLDTISEQDLPKEGRATLRLIRAGGPFPYDKDGSVFQNREGLLPKKPRGYYREYTVITPRESDRGARRIVAGENGELYYTDDHYDSFKRVTP